MLSPSCRGLLLGLLAISVSPAHAVVVTFEYAGYVDIVDDPHGYLDGSIQLGTPFSASCSFETSTPPTYVNPPATWYYGALTAFALQVGSYTVTDMGVYSRILVEDTADGGDGFLIVNDPRRFAGRWVSIGLDLFNGGGQVFASSGLPTAPPRLEDFEICEFAVINGGFGVHGVITSLTPEPSTLLLLAGGGWMACKRPGRGNRGDFRSLALRTVERPKAAGR